MTATTTLDSGTNRAAARGGDWAFTAMLFSLCLVGFYRLTQPCLHWFDSVMVLKACRDGVGQRDRVLEREARARGTAGSAGTGTGSATGKQSASGTARGGPAAPVGDGSGPRGPAR